MEFHAKNYLVTGGLGFIGCNMIKLLLDQNQTGTVVNLDKVSYAANSDALKSNEHDSRYHFIKADICDKAKVVEILKSYKIDTVIHFAAESHVDRSISGPADFISNNIYGTFQLLEACRAVWLDELDYGVEDCRFHHVSTDEVYGSLAMDDTPFTEASPYDPRSPYSASKASSDHLVMAYFHTYNLPVTLSNCSNNYGPYQHSEKLIPKVISSCIHQQIIPVYGSGLNIRDWLYVEDHCHEIDLILRNGLIGEKYNIGGGNEWSNIDIVKFICNYIDNKMPRGQSCSALIRHVADRKGHDLRYAISSIKELKNQKTYKVLSEKLPETIDWYLNYFQDKQTRQSRQANKQIA